MQATAASWPSITNWRSIDLGPLAWVLDELRKSLDGATKAIRRFGRDAELARGSDLESLDASQLRIAAQQLHQAVGALEWWVWARRPRFCVPWKRCQKFVQRPGVFAAKMPPAKVERASFALSGIPRRGVTWQVVSSVALFPQLSARAGTGSARSASIPQICGPLNGAGSMRPCRTVEALAYALRYAPGWTLPWLKMVKTGSVSSTKALRDISLGFCGLSTGLESRVFLENLCRLLRGDRPQAVPGRCFRPNGPHPGCLMQYTSLARGGRMCPIDWPGPAVFLCPGRSGQRSRCPCVGGHPSGLWTGASPARWITKQPQFGRFDPALLVQVRKRIATATETWSALAGGDTNRLKVVSDQFNLVSESC